MLRNVIALALPIIAAGCISLGFDTERKSQFTDANNNSVFVEYATEERTENMPNGGEITFNRKVRLTLPDGSRVVLYQTISTSGVRYHTKDDEYIFVERGPWCRIFQDGDLVYQGIFCNNCSIE